MIWWKIALLKRSLSNHLIFYPLQFWPLQSTLIAYHFLLDPKYDKWCIYYSRERAVRNFLLRYTSAHMVKRIKPFHILETIIMCYIIWNHLSFFHTQYWKAPITKKMVFFMLLDMMVILYISIWSDLFKLSLLVTHIFIYFHN